MIVTELPPNANSAKILAEIEEQTNPKPKAGKKQLNQDQLNTKKLMLDLIDRVRDESDGEHPVRLVFEPKSSRIDTDTFINTLMAQTSLEGNVSMNLVMMGFGQPPCAEKPENDFAGMVGFPRRDRNTPSEIPFEPSGKTVAHP